MIAITVGRWHFLHDDLQQGVGGVEISQVIIITIL